KGAHPSDPAMPMTWTHVAEALNIPARSPATTRLQHQYADVYQRMQAYYAAADEPAAKYDQTLYHAEGFDLYNYGAGNKYWHHRNDNIVSHHAPAQTDSPAIDTTDAKMIATTDAAIDKFDEHNDEDKENYNPVRNGLDTAPASMHHISGIQGDTTTALDGAPGLSDQAAVWYKDTSARQSTPFNKVIGNGRTATAPHFDDDKPVGLDEQAYEEGKRRLVRLSPQ
ncbi:MAG: hypothetical protein Q9180_006755, partial [Flavoplaca navasiana]